MTEVNIELNNSTNENKYEGDYNYEIELSSFQKFLVFFLNLLTGGLGTMLVPFLNKKRKAKTMIIAGIILGIMQIFHVLHFFSLLSGAPFIEKIYERICDDEFLSNFITIENESNSKDDDNNEKVLSFFGNLIENLNISSLIIKKQRIKTLKWIFGLISGFSYGNSLFTVLVNLLEAKKDSPNKKLAIKIFLYNIFNPGSGIILSCFALFPACDCENEKYDKTGIALSIAGIIFGLFILFCPVLLGFGTFIVKITDNMLSFFPLKITLIFIGVLGIVISFILSGVNCNTILEAAKTKVRPLELIFGCGDYSYNLISSFGISSFVRLILNLIIPGSGTLFLQCKYGCNICIILVSIFQFAIGGMFFYTSISILINHDCYSDSYESFFNEILNTTTNLIGDRLDENIVAQKVFNLFYTYGLCFYFSGFYIILALDYIDDIKDIAPYATCLAYIFLSSLTGGLGFALFLPTFLVYYRIIYWANELLGLIILVGGGFICYGGFVYSLFFWDFVNKASKVCFTLFYCCVVCAYAALKA